MGEYEVQILITVAAFCLGYMCSNYIRESEVKETEEWLTESIFDAARFGLMVIDERGANEIESTARIGKREVAVSIKEIPDASKAAKA